MQKTKGVTGISHQETVTYKFILQRDLTLSESVTGSSLKMQKMKRVTGILHPETVTYKFILHRDFTLSESFTRAVWLSSIQLLPNSSRTETIQDKL